MNDVIAFRRETLHLVRTMIASLPYEEQRDIETVARTFRNMLAVGKVANLAFMLVATEIALDMEIANAKVEKKK